MHPGALGRVQLQVQRLGQRPAAQHRRRRRGLQHTAHRFGVATPQRISLLPLKLHPLQLELLARLQAVLAAATTTARGVIDTLASA